MVADHLRACGNGVEVGAPCGGGDGVDAGDYLPCLLAPDAG